AACIHHQSIAVSHFCRRQPRDRPLRSGIGGHALAEARLVQGIGNRGAAMNAQDDALFGHLDDIAPDGLARYLELGGELANPAGAALLERAQDRRLAQGTMHLSTPDRAYSLAGPIPEQQGAADRAFCRIWSKT